MKVSIALDNRGHVLPGLSFRSLRARFEGAKGARPCRGTASAVARDTAVPSPSASDQIHQGEVELVCPICLSTKFSISTSPSQREHSCPRCRRSFTSTKDYVDLTLTSGIKPKVYQNTFLGTELFRQPTVSFAYERGWRQSFVFSGFPGVDAEFEMAMRYLEPAFGDTLLDMSCGTGLFTRKFAKSKKFAWVLAGDYSESMLQQAGAFFDQDPELRGRNSILRIRADIGRLPFATASLPAVHAAAAIHCWPNPLGAMAEISRVLKPGGVFVGSTFMVPTAPIGQVLGDDLVRPLNQLAGTPRAYKWWEEQELRDLMTTVGLDEWDSYRSWRFIMFAVRKPT